jgi:DnaJ-class molecular chaperone
MTMIVAERPPTETCERCQGNGEIVTDWERYLHALPGDAGDEAVAECSDCDGTGTVLPTYGEDDRGLHE